MATQEEIEKFIMHKCKIIKDKEMTRTQPGSIKYLMFGSETKGLPKECLTHEKCKKVIRIPMADGSRSLNLSNSVAITVYFALGQNDFTGLS